MIFISVFLSSAGFATAGRTHVPLISHGTNLQGTVKPHPSPILLRMNATSAQAWTDAHNAKRSDHGVPNLEWDNDMAANAQSWADNLAAAGSMTHSASYDLQPPLGPAGENLAYKWSSQSNVQQTPAEAVDAWYSEINVCSWPGCQDPDSQLCDQYEGQVPCMVGHFTALIWKDAITLGCGQKMLNLNGGASRVFSVCQYKGTDTKTCATPNMGGCYNDQVTNVGSGGDGGSGGAPTPTPAPTPTTPPPLVQKCVTEGSVGLCGECKESSDCNGDTFCCPYMKKCIADSSTSCSYPVAFCSPVCHDAVCSTCEPSDGSDYNTQWTCDRCIARDTWHGPCGDYTWACTDDRYPWFRNSCALTCGTCDTGLLQNHTAKPHVHTTKFADKILMTVDPDGKTSLGK